MTEALYQRDSYCRAFNARVTAQDAQQGAHALAQKAQSFGDTQVRESNRYAQEVLSRLEAQLSAALNSIRLGLDSLESQEVKAAAPTD